MYACMDALTDGWIIEDSTGESKATDRVEREYHLAVRGLNWHQEAPESTTCKVGSTANQHVVTN